MTGRGAERRQWRRIRTDALVPGDIVLTASRTREGKGVRLATLGKVSHAMICVQHASVIDSTMQGVQSRNVQREFLKAGEKAFAFRMKVPLEPDRLRLVVDFARSQIGAGYSVSEAVRSVVGGRRPRTKKQFCSRLVAQAYAYAGVQLVPDVDYCTPDALRKCGLLSELPDVTEPVDEEEVEAWRNRPDPTETTRRAHNEILAGARALDPNIETMADVARVVVDRPEWDARIAAIIVASGYLDIWRIEIATHPWRYDIAEMSAMASAGHGQEIRSFCQDMIREINSGGQRYRTMLGTYLASQMAAPRETTRLMVALYGQLVRNDDALRRTCLEWLALHHPADIAMHVEADR